MIRERAIDPSFGWIAMVRRAALDLRNNLKNCSYGDVNVLRVELSQMLDESFKVLESKDLMAQFGATNAWDMIELILWQYFHESVQASTMNRMAVAGRDIIRWLGQPFVLNKDRNAFETMLFRVAESAEEWISSLEGLQSGTVTAPPRQPFARRPSPFSARGVSLAYATESEAI